MGSSRVCSCRWRNPAAFSCTAQRRAPSPPDEGLGERFERISSEVVSAIIGCQAVVLLQYDWAASVVEAAQARMNIALHGSPQQERRASQPAYWQCVLAREEL
eukprot:TRINITY_DN22839_c0_g1_i3.p1 TRINITY_DN22839_c0_g1~~TRINITY_DN22839_c0_g1_i3.p1  ORF type:complete len:103 (+),score=6.64 TRINITY_DN22839_c0_g1_i3:153-461(+)